MARSPTDLAWWRVDPLGVGRLLLPTLAAAAVLALLSSGSAWVRVAAPLLTAVAVAMLLVAVRQGRVVRLRRWVQRVRRGETAVLPLARRAPDQIDRLVIDLRAMADDLRGTITRLEFERDRLEAILGAMVEGVIVIDSAGSVLRANAPVRETFRLPPEVPLVGAKLWDLSRDVEFNAVVRAVLAERTPTVREVEIEGAKPRFIRLAAGPTGDGTAWVLVFHDVTETKRLERIRTDFVANVSHELRTPLTAIKGFAEKLVEGGIDDPESSVRQLSIIDRQAERLSRLIDDLLVLSDLEIGRMPVRPEATRVTDALTEVAEILAQPAQAGGVELRLELDDDLVVNADPDRLVQVFANLVDNAVKYTPKGGRVTVRGARSDDGSQVRIDVVDTGVGIPAEDLPRLAERFYRVDKARSREFGGTGLGLSIVKHIVQAHGGRLDIQSRLGVGTTVSVTLPADSVEALVR